MIEVLYGLPGDGKSYSAVKMALMMVQMTKAYVVHNLPLEVYGEVASYVDKQFRSKASQADVDFLSQRAKHLDDDQVTQFYRCLGPGVEPGLDISLRLGGSRLVHVPDYSVITTDFPGVMYILDEAHNFFDAYHADEFGDTLRWVFSQHRKLGMEIVLVTQHPDKIAKALRRDIHRWTRVKNYGNRRFYGFVARGWFRTVTYAELPVRGSIPVIEDSASFQFDAELAKLYNTNTGIGIVGRAFRVERRLKGLPLRSLWVIIPLVLALCWCIPFFGTTLLGKGISSAVNHSNQISHAIPKAIGLDVSKVAGLSPQTKMADIPAVGPRTLGNESFDASTIGGDAVYLSSVAFCSFFPRSSSWTLSDGRVVTYRTPGFEGGGPDNVIVAGRTYFYESRVSSVPSSSFPGRRRYSGY